MGYSKDLRVRVIQVVENGAAARAAARQFVLGDSTAIRWVKRWRETGSAEAKSIKGQSRSPLKRHEEWLLDLVRREPDLTLEEIQRLELEAGFAQELYKSALAALEQGRIEAVRTLKKVSVLQAPTLPEYPLQPRRVYNTVVTALLAVLLAGVLNLIIIIVRDHRD